MEPVNEDFIQDLENSLRRRTLKKKSSVSKIAPPKKKYDRNKFKHELKQVITNLTDLDEEL